MKLADLHLTADKILGAVYKFYCDFIEWRNRFLSEMYAREEFLKGPDLIASPDSNTKINYT